MLVIPGRPWAIDALDVNAGCSGRAFCDCDSSASSPLSVASFAFVVA